jgi:hypothetical protein
MGESDKYIGVKNMYKFKCSLLGVDYAESIVIKTDQKDCEIYVNYADYKQAWPFKFKANKSESEIVLYIGQLFRLHETPVLEIVAIGRDMPVISATCNYIMTTPAITHALVDLGGKIEVKIYNDTWELTTFNNGERHKCDTVKMIDLV